MNKPSDEYICTKCKNTFSVKEATAETTGPYDCPECGNKYLKLKG